MTCAIVERPAAHASLSLNAIVGAVGGDLKDRARRAVIPGPGHSQQDRSVSLLISNKRLVVHSLGRSTWRDVMDELRALGLVDRAGRPATGPGSGWAAPAPRAAAARIEAAERLWSQAAPLARRHALAPVRRHCVTREAPVSAALRLHPRVPLVVYAQKGPRRPALLAAVTDAAGDL